MSVLLIETAVLLGMAAVGWVVVGPARGPVWRVAAALPFGIAATTVVELVLLVARVPLARPWVALVLTLLAAGAVAVRRRGRDPSVAPLVGTTGVTTRRALLVGGVTLVAVVALTAWLPLVNLTADSFRFIPSSHVLSSTGSLEGVSLFLLTTRGLVMPTLHGLAVTEFGYLRAVGPLLGLSTVALLWLLVEDGTRRLGGRLPRTLGVAAALLLLTTSRFLFSTFYLNAHVLFACWLLLVVTLVRSMRLRPDDGAGARDAWLVGLLAAGLALLRAEGALVAVLALAPLVVATAVPLRRRRVPVVVTGAVVATWQLGLLLPVGLASPLPMDPSVPGLGALGVALVVVAPLLGVLVDRVPRPLLVAHGLVWLGAVALASTDPGIVLESLEATMTNLTGEGLWGGSLLVLAALFVLAAALRRVDGEQAVVFPLVTFVPLAALLALLRGHAYRVGPGDSLNRMLLHLVPTAILLVALSAAGRWRRERDAATAEWTAPE